MKRNDIRGLRDQQLLRMHDRELVSRVGARILEC